MARAYPDDLRRRILQSYDQGEGGPRPTSATLPVSLGDVKKIRRELRHMGKMERVPHHPGRSSRFIEPVRQHLRSWQEQQSDLSLAELQEQLRCQPRLQVNVPSLQRVLGKIGLRLKKSHSTRKSATRKPTSNGAKPSLKSSVPSPPRS